MTQRKNSKGQARRIGIVLAGSLLAFGGWNQPAVATVPPGLVQRQHEPAVESILAELEAKAASLGQGSFAVSGGPKDRPALRWSLETDGRRWSLMQVDTAYVLYSDGGECFELPSRLRFAVDTLLRAGKEDLSWRDYRLGFLLLNMNLHPRQFLGGIGGLRTLGNETIDGVSCVRLQAEPARDAIAQADSPLLPGTGASVLDVYYDPQKKAVVRVGLTAQGWEDRAEVRQWDSFGTVHQLPKQIWGQPWKTSVQPSKPGDHVIVTFVESFSAGKNSNLEAARQQVESMAFFGAVEADLRRPEVYQQALAANPQSLSDQVALAQALFVSGRIDDANRVWSDLESRLANEQDRQQLGSCLVPAAMLAARGSSDAATAAALLQKVAGLSLSRAQWQSVSPAVLEAYKSVKGKAGLAETEPVLLSLLARKGSASVIGGLLDLAGKDPADAGRIEPLLNEVAAEPVGPKTYLESQHMTLVLGSLSKKGKAKGYADKLGWKPETPADAKLPGHTMKRLASLDAEAAPGTAQRGAALAELYGLTQGPAFAAAPGAQETLHWHLVGLGFDAVRLKHKDASAAGAAELVAASVNQPAALKYWDGVIHRMVNWKSGKVQEMDQQIQSTIALAQAVQQQLNQPDYVAKTWLKMGKSPLGNADYASNRVDRDCAHKAFAAATNDDMRLEVLRALVDTLAGGGAHGEAIQTVQGLSSGFTTEQGRSACDAMVVQLQKDAGVFQTRLDSTERRRNIARLEAQIKELESQLDAARAAGHAQADVEAIQQLIKELQQELEQVR